MQLCVFVEDEWFAVDAYVQKLLALAAQRFLYVPRSVSCIQPMRALSRHGDLMHSKLCPQWPLFPSTTGEILSTRAKPTRDPTSTLASG